MFSRRQLFTRVSELEDGVIEFVRADNPDEDAVVVLELTLAAAEDLAEELQYRAQEGRDTVQYKLDQKMNPAPEGENDDKPARLYPRRPFSGPRGRTRRFVE